MARPDTGGLAKAKKVIGTVMKHRVAKALFNNPVDVEALDVPDYYDIIRNPMDFTAIIERIEKALSNGKRCKYKTVDDVFEDVELIWNNCYTYNSRPQDAPTRELCEEVKTYFLDEWKAAGLPIPKGVEETSQVENSSAELDYSKGGRELQVPSIFSVVDEQCPLPLRLLDCFTVYSVEDQELYESLDAATAGTLLVRGTLVLPDSVSGHDGSTYNVKLRVVDWCVHYGNTPSIWIISENAWYKLLTAAPEYERIFADLQQNVALCWDGVCELHSNPKRNVHDLVRDLLVSRAANHRSKSSIPQTSGVEFITQQLLAWQKAAKESTKTERSTATGLVKPTRAKASKAVLEDSFDQEDPPELLFGSRKRRTSGRAAVVADENVSASANVEDHLSKGRKRGATENALGYGEATRRSKRQRVKGDEPGSPRLKLKLGGKIVSSGQQSASRDHHTNRATPILTKSASGKGDHGDVGATDGQRRLKVKLKDLNKISEVDEKAQDTPRLVVRFGGANKDGERINLRLPAMSTAGSYSESSYRSDESPAEEGRVRPRRIQMSAAERRRLSEQRHQAELAARRARYHQQKEAEAERLRKEKEAVLQAKLDKENQADAARGPPPKCTSLFRAPGEVLADLLEVWDFTQSVQELLQLPSFPLWRLEAAVCPGPKLEHAAGPPPSAQQAATPVSAYGTLPPLHMSTTADLEGLASGAVLRDICTSLLSAVEGRSQGEGKKAKAAAVDISEGWWDRISLALVQAAEGAINEQARAAALKLAYSDYLDLTVAQRVCILGALVHMALDTDVVRDYITQQVEPGSKVKKQEGSVAGGSVAGDEDDEETKAGPGPALAQPPAGAPLPGSPEEWLQWMENCGVGVRKPLGIDFHGRRYWVLGRKSGAWRVYVEMADGQKWGWYEGTQLFALVNWLRLGDIEVEAPLFKALMSAPIVVEAKPREVPVPVPVAERVPLEGHELQERRPDSYRGVVLPLLRGEGNWARMVGTLGEKVLLAMDSMLGATGFWFKDDIWLKRLIAVLDAIQGARTAADMVQPLLQLEGMLLESRVLGPEWMATWQGLWRRGLSRCTDMRDLLMHVAALQEHLLWDNVKAINRNVFLKLEQEARCQLFVPEPNQPVVILKQGLLMHVDQYMQQLGFAVEDSDSEDELVDGRQQMRGQWRQLRDRVEELNPVEQYVVSTIAYQRYLDPDATPESEAAGMTIAWPLCWILLRPSKHSPPHQRPAQEIVVPLHVDHTLPDYIVQADVYDRGMRRTWAAGDRFRMFFGGKMTGSKSAGTYYKGTILDVSELQQPIAPKVEDDEDPYDPWEAVLVQWDSSNLEEGTIERVNPWEIEVDPDEEKRRYDELRRQGEAAARAARLQAKTKRLQLDNLPAEPSAGCLSVQSDPPKDVMLQCLEAYTTSLTDVDVKQEAEVGYHNPTQANHLVTTTNMPATERSTANVSGNTTIRLHSTESPVAKVILDQLRQLDKHQLKTLLTNFYRTVKGKYKIPVFAHQELDLHKVFWEVQDRGGYDCVTQLKLWKDVCRSLQVDLRGQTSASYNMRLNYEKCLLDFEKYLSSGGYASDLASGQAPSHTEVVQLRPSSRLNNVSASASSPPVSGFATPAGVADCTSAAVFPQFAVPMQQKLPPGTRIATAFSDPLGAQLALAQALLPVQLIHPPRSNGLQLDHSNQGGFTSFTELLAADDTPSVPPQPASTCSPAGRSSAPKVLPLPQNANGRSAPWLRLIAPSGPALLNRLNGNSKGWLAQGMSPPVAQSEYPIYQQLQPLSDENLGSFLHRQGSAIHAVKLLRFRQEIMQFVTVEVTGYNPNTGEHCLNYDTAQDGTCASGQEWVDLLQLSNDELKSHPSAPLNTVLDSAKTPNFGSRGDAAAKDNNHTMDAIMAALLSGMPVDVLHNMVDMAANMVSHRKGGMIAPMAMPSLATGDQAGTPASEQEPSGNTNHHMTSTSAQDGQHENVDQHQHSTAYLENGPLDHRDSRSLPSHSGGFGQQLSDVRHLSMHDQLTDLQLHADMQQHLQSSRGQANLVDLAAHLPQGTVESLKGVDVDMGIADAPFSHHRMLYGTTAQLLDHRPAIMDADHPHQLQPAADVSQLYMSNEELGVAMQPSWSSGLAMDPNGLLQGRLGLHHQRMNEPNSTYQYNSQLVGLGRSSIVDEQANLSHNLALHYANQALQ